MGASKIFMAFMTYVCFPLRATKHLEAIIDRLNKMETTMSAALDKIRQEVAENKDAVEATKVLLSNLSQQIRDNKGDEEALEELAASLDAQNAELAAAVTENTPFTPSGQ